LRCGSRCNSPKKENNSGSAFSRHTRIHEKPRRVIRRKTRFSADTEDALQDRKRAFNQGRFYEGLEGGKLRCVLCPHRCVLPEGGRGRCKVRGNEGGALALPFYGYISALASDPVEKKPLYHFRPGSEVLSAGFAGCNLRCPFCQNWHISQRVPAPETSESGTFRVMRPEELITLARERGNRQIAYTYSEPLVHTEYLLDAMALARKAGLANILVTNGTVSAGTAEAILSLCDAVNVDLKTFSPETCAKILGGNLDAVLAFIKKAHALKVHVEVTTLVVTGINDHLDELEHIAAFIAGISPAIPWHLSAYHPDWKWNESPTDPALLVEAASRFRKTLNFVYTGNIPGGNFSGTPCPHCGAAVITRQGYRVDCSGLTVRKGTCFCAACGKEAAFIRM
jgi:pyruvate formate lyase activating enzyme